MTTTSVPTVEAREIIKGLHPSDFRKLGGAREITTNFGAANYIHRMRARSAPHTRANVEGTWTEDDHKTVENVYQVLRAMTLLQVDLKMCKSEPSYHVRVYLPKHHAELAYFASQSMYRAPDEWIERERADITTIDLPDWGNLVTQPADRCILVDAENCITYVLGSDYYGEIKKSLLRLTMYKAKQEGRLGLHAGSKEVWAKSRKSGRIKKCGLLFFGLSGTGKTSLTGHDYDLDTSAGERVRVLQDDVAVLNRDGSVQGTEGKGFFIKTEDLSPEDQRALYEAVMADDAVMENVWVNADGSVDFFNDIISKNGRAVVQIHRVIGADGVIDMEACTHVFFITRNPLMPVVAKLNAEQAAAAFMMGESIKTSAADPKAKGEAVRVVGTNPFIVGPKDEEGNIFYELLVRNPDITCYVLNTGYVGKGDRARKVSITETVNLIREVCREGIEWKESEIYPLHVPAKVPNMDIEDMRVKARFDREELQRELAKLREDRQAWLDQFKALRPRIQAAAY